MLGSTAVLVASGTSYAADLPVNKAVPIEFVRVCSAYGAGFFYIPGTDTCLRLSGRARFEGTYAPAYSRSAASQVSGGGDTASYRALMRINIDARTQTAYGTLRAFTRLEAASRTGGSYLTGTSGTQQRIGNAFFATGIDGFGRAQQYVNVDKAFIQFSGLTAGRASSFFDFYAHDFEFNTNTAGSDVQSTNLLAYTATVGNGLSATISIEDPTFRRTPIFTPFTAALAGGIGSLNNSNGGVTFSPLPVFDGYTAGVPTRFTAIDSIERNRMPDFVGVIRYDQPWGSLQLSAAVHELNVGNVANGTVNAAGNLTPPATTIFGATVTSNGVGDIVAPRHTNSDYGYAVQGGVKVNMPFVAPGDAFYLQGAYGVGAQAYTGYNQFSGGYIQATSAIEGQKFLQYFSDATVNPVTGQFQKSESFTVVGSYLHYWTPEWRSSFFASYGEMNFSNASRNGQGLIYSVLSANGIFPGATAVGAPGTRFFQLSEALRNTYQVVAGGTLIWSPVKDLDIGVEGLYTQIGVQNGRVIDRDKDPTAYSANRVALINAGGAVRTVTQDSVAMVRFRVQRDF